MNQNITVLVLNFKSDYGWKSGVSYAWENSFLYGSKNLIGKNGIIMNADCHLDRGFEYLEKKKLRKKTMYSLTRHGPSANRGPCTVADICGPDILIKGFMTAWVFRFAYTTCCTIYVVFHSRGFYDIPRALIADASHFHCIVPAPTKLKPAAPSCWDHFRGKAYCTYAMGKITFKKNVPYSLLSGITCLSEVASK